MNQIQAAVLKPWVNPYQGTTITEARAIVNPNIRMVPSSGAGCRRGGRVHGEGSSIGQGKSRIVAEPASNAYPGAGTGSLFGAKKRLECRLGRLNGGIARREASRDGLEVATEICAFLLEHRVRDRLRAMLCLGEIVEPAHPADV